MSSSPVFCSSASPGTHRSGNPFGLGGIQEFWMNRVSGSSSTSLPVSREIFVKFSNPNIGHLQTFVSDLSKAELPNLLGPLHLPALRSVSTGYLALSRTLHKFDTSPKLEPRCTGSLLRLYPTPLELEPSCTRLLWYLSVTASRLGLRFRAPVLRLAPSRVPNWNPCQSDLSRSFVSGTIMFLFIFTEI